MQRSTCMFSCRHPIWGGEGTCSSDHHDPPRCLCGGGFASRDALGHASCVPYGVLITGYLVLAALSLLTLVQLGRHLAEYRFLSDGARCSRKTTIRLSVLLSGSLYAAGMVVLGVILAGLGGKTSLNDTGVVQALYLVMLPSAMFCVFMIAKFWVESLPSQLIPAESFAMKLRDASEHKDIFVVLGCLNAGGISTLGVATFFVPAWPQLIADVAALFGVFVAVVAILFVAVQITQCINEAKAKANTSGIHFYENARRNLWRQALILNGVGVIAFVSILVKRLTVVGRGTPIISWNFQASTCNMACVLFTLFTKFEEPGRRLTRSSLTRTADVSTTRRTSLLEVGTVAAQQVLQQLKPQGLQIIARKGLNYIRQAQAPPQARQERGLVGASCDQSGMFPPVETANADTQVLHDRVGWAATSILRDATRSAFGPLHKAKVSPTEGDTSACKKVPPA